MVALLRSVKGEHVPAHVAEVLLSLLGRARAETLNIEMMSLSARVSRQGQPHPTHLVVLWVPALAAVILLAPLLELGQREERLLILALGHLDNRRNELDEEAIELEQRRVEVVEVVDEETLDVRSIMILARAEGVNTSAPG